MRCALVLLVFLGLAVAHLAVWEHQHDDGVTYDLDVAEIELARDVAEAPPVAELTARLWARPDRSAADVLGALTTSSGGQPHPPLHHLAVQGIGSLFGSSPLVLRLPSWVAGLLMLLGLARLANHLAPGRGLGFAVALTVAVAPWTHMIHAFLRPYAFALCAAVWTAEGLVQGLAHPERRGPWIRLAFALALGLYSLYHFVFCVAAAAFCGLAGALVGARSKRRIRLVRGIGAFVAAFILFLPWLPAFLRHLSKGAGAGMHYMGALPLDEWPERLSILGRRFLLGELEGPDWIAPFVLLLVSVAALASATCGLRAAGRAAAFGALFALSFALGVVAADLAKASHTLFFTKYAFGIYPFAMLAGVAALFGLPGKRTGVFAVGVAVLTLGSASLLQLRGHVDGESGPERLARELAARDASDHVALFATSRRGLIIALLLEAREAGLGQMRWWRVESAELTDRFEDLDASPDVREVSVVGLDAGFLPPSQRLSRALLERLMRDALEAGWRVRWFEPDGGRPRERGDPAAERVLNVFVAVPSRYFRA